MRVTKTPGQAPKFEFEAGSPKEIFEKLALLDAIFTESKCGACGSSDIIYVNRPVDNGSYLELRCNKCRAQLSFGQNKDGKSIFKKNWDKEAKRAMPNGGWFIYQAGNQSSGDASEGTTQARQPAQQMSEGDMPF